MDDNSSHMKKKIEPTELEKRRMKIVPESLLKAEMRPGRGTSRPSDGDQVMYHCIVRTLEAVVVESTRSDYGGTGIPARIVMGKSKMLLGLVEGLSTMLIGEVAMFKLKPSMHYGEENCPLLPPVNFPKHDELQFEIEMIEFGKAKVVSEDFGVIKKVIDEGKGWESPREPYEVEARISAKSGDGKVILSSHSDTYTFTIGKSEIPKGLEMAIGTMSREEKAAVYVTSEYLTDCSLLPTMDGYKEVHFEVSLLHFVQVRDMLGDGRLIKRRIRNGTGEFPMDCPLQDSLLRVHYKGMLQSDGSVFYDTRVDNDGRHLEFRSGEGLVPEGFEMCVRLMLPGEVAHITCPPDFAYDKFARPSNVPQGAHIQWQIELLGFEMPKDWSGMTFQNIMDETEMIKTTGNRLFKEGKYELAKAKYEKVLRDFNHVNPQDDEEGKIYGNTRNIMNLNVAACLLKLGECRKSIEACNKVLESNPAHAKALYRRGMAFMEVGDFDSAKNDFEMMIKVDKFSEADAKSALWKLKQNQMLTDMIARKEFKGLFDKKPGHIADLQSFDESESDDSDEATPTATAPAPATWFSFRNRMFSFIPFQRCTIL